MNWYTILKKPIYVGDDYPPLEEKPKFDTSFLWLQNFNKNDFNLKFISKDGRARATVHIDVENDKLIWVLNSFVVESDYRGEGLGNIALSELIDEIRENELKFLNNIYVNLQTIDVPNYGSEADEQTLVKKLKEMIKTSTAPMLDIKVVDIDPDAGMFWTKMFSRYGYIGLRKSVQVTNTKQGIKTSQRKLPKPEEDKPPECVEIVKAIDNKIKEFCLKCNEFGKNKFKHTRPSWNENILSYNFTGKSNMHRMFDAHWELAPAVIHNPGDDGSWKNTVFNLDCIWVSGDNINEKQACDLLRHIVESDVSANKYSDSGVVYDNFSTVRNYDWERAATNSAENNTIQITFGVKNLGVLKNYYKQLIGAPKISDEEFEEVFTTINKELQLPFVEIIKFIKSEARRWYNSI
jgi:hypothetical protein